MNGNTVQPSKVFTARLFEPGGVNSRHEIVKLANQIPTDGRMDNFERSVGEENARIERAFGRGRMNIYIYIFVWNTVN